jgi:hypothetical protein
VHAAGTVTLLAARRPRAPTSLPSEEAMRGAALVSCLLLSLGSVSAQSPLTVPLVPTNEGNAGGAIYFDLQVHSTAAISRIDSGVGTQGLAGDLELEIWLGPPSYFGNTGGNQMWSRIATATATGFVPNGARQIVPFLLGAPLALGPGDYGVALVSQAVPQPGFARWNHAYTNGATCTSSTVPGSCANTVHANAELTVRGGAAQNAAFMLPMFQPRMWTGSLHYGVGGTPIQLAQWRAFGSGCFGSGGVPSLAPIRRPVLGGSFDVGVASPPVAFTTGIAVYGLSNTAWYYLPLPLELGFHGLPGCHQYTDIVATEVFGVGQASTTIRSDVPNVAALAGQRFHLQAVLVDPGAPNALGVTTTNALTGIVGL